MSLASQYIVAKRRMKALSRTTKENHRPRANYESPAAMSPQPGALDVVDCENDDFDSKSSYLPSPRLPGVANPQFQTPSPPGARAQGRDSDLRRCRPSTLELNDTMDELLDTISNEIRTAGLRKGRENVLVDLVAELRDSSRDQRQSCKKMVKEWALFAEATLSSKNGIEREMEENALRFKESKKESELEEERKSSEHRAALRELMEKLANVTSEVQDCKSVAAKEREEYIVAFKKREDEMENRLQSEVSRIKSKTAREAEKKAATCVERVSAEFMKKMKALKVRVEEGVSFKGRCAELERENGRIKEVIAEERERWDEERTESSGAMDMLMEENVSLLKAESELKRELEKIREEKVEDIAKQRERRRVEFEGVEARVREVVSKKDATIRTLLERAELAEKRAAQLQNFLSKLDRDINLEG
tara:strand:+ start:2348 stop:3610 length:1263 start_codon:yes stop_codon:yes gene_type:complete